VRIFVVSSLSQEAEVPSNQLGLARNYQRESGVSTALIQNPGLRHQAVVQISPAYER